LDLLEKEIRNAIRAKLDAAEVARVNELKRQQAKASAAPVVENNNNVRIVNFTKHFSSDG
jgi:hypothetical protein